MPRLFKSPTGASDSLVFRGMPVSPQTKDCESTRPLASRAMNEPSRLKRWTEWVEGDLWKEVHEIFNQVLVFRSWNEIIGEASEESKKPGFFHAWVTHNYLDSIASGVRRLSDADDRTNSLRRLLIEIREDADELTLDWWMSRALPDAEDVWERSFAELSNGGEGLDPHVVEADEAELLDVCGKLKGYVDKNIAHLDADRSHIEMPTIGDAHEAVRSIYRIYHRWFQVVTGSSLAPLRPPRWEHVLATSWIDMETAALISDRRRDEWDKDMHDLGIRT